MPDRPGMHGKDRPGTSLVAPKPKKPTPDNNMDVPEDDPWVTPKKKKDKKKDKKNKQRRALLQVDRTFTPKEWQTIARSVPDRRRPYRPSSVDFGRPRIGGGYRARKKLQRNRATYPVGSRFWRR